MKLIMNMWLKIFLETKFTYLMDRMTSFFKVIGQMKMNKKSNFNSKCFCVFIFV